MIETLKPPTDDRDSLALTDQARARAAAFVPEVVFRDGSVSAGLTAAVTRYVESLLQRLKQSPEKNRLAFYDTLALQLTPAQPSRAPLVFQLNYKAPSGSAPQGTAVAAPPPPGSQSQLIFETETARGITSGKLVELVSLWPGRDQYADHSADFAAGMPLRLFDDDKLIQIPHHLYLAHTVLLALSGTVKLSVQFQMARGGSEPLRLIWEYWDGKVWRSFLPVDPACSSAGVALADSTNGLTQSGRVELKADGATSAATAVNGASNFWIRARVDELLLPDTSRTLPEIDNIRLSSIVEQPFRATLSAGPLLHTDSHVINVVNDAGEPTPCESLTVTVLDSLTGVVQDLSYPQGSPGAFSLAALNFTQYKVQAVAVATFAMQVPAVKIPTPPTNQFSAFTLTLSIVGLAPDKAFAGGTKLDVTKPFYPFGQQPQPGTSFYFTSAEAFSKPNAKLRVYLPLTSAPVNSIQSNDTSAKRTKLTPTVVWEYWNGRAWALIPQASSTTAVALDFSITEIVGFTVPPDVELVKVNDQEALWMRARLVAGGFGYIQEIGWQAGTGTNPPVNTISYIVTQPPILASCAIGYAWQHGPFPLDYVTTYNDFRYADHTADASWPGITFPPFQRTADTTPSVYLGFDKKPPEDDLGIFFDVQEENGEVRGPAMLWEYFDGGAWQRVPVEDETGNIRVPGILSFLSEDDSAALARFDTPLHWLRGRLKEDGPPGSPLLDGIFVNAVWASQQHTLTDQPVGKSDGTPGQVFSLPQIPILAGEQIEVREISGARANVEWRILARDLFGTDPAIIRDLEDELGREGTDLDTQFRTLRLRRDRNKNVVEAWVRWQPLDTLLGSGPLDRVYAVDRARGLFTFGDGSTGRVPPNGSAILARVVATGGGSAGNVPAQAIAQLMGVVPGIQSVFNPLPAEGGADGETVANFARRAPATVRHRGRAVTLADYEAMAREATATVAFARAIPTRTSSGHALPGYVTVIILPDSLDPRPYPSIGLRTEVTKYIEQHAPADLAGRITVTGPPYLPIDIEATLAPVEFSQAGVVERAAQAALAAFLHPLYGGPTGDGWVLGRDVFLSDVAAVLERVPGLDYVSDLALLIQSVPQGTSIRVADDQIVVAGNIRLKVIAAER